MQRMPPEAYLFQFKFPGEVTFSETVCTACTRCEEQKFQLRLKYKYKECYSNVEWNLPTEGIYQRNDDSQGLMVQAGEFISTSLAGNYMSHPYIYIVAFAEDTEVAYNRANNLLHEIFLDSKNYPTWRSGHSKEGIYFYIEHKPDYEAEDREYIAKRAEHWLYQKYPTACRPQGQLIILNKHLVRR